jgi:hypothetical protein
MEDGHSLSYTEDPVRTVRHLPRFRLCGRRFTWRVDHALVCVTRKGGYEVFPPPQRPTSLRRFVALYEVDTGPHAFRLSVPLPSLVDSFEFDAIADVTWRVAAPDRFVRSQERNVPALLARELLPVLRAASRGHGIEASAEAEAAVQQAVRQASHIGTDEGLWVACSVRLRRDVVERFHQARLRTVRHEVEAAEQEHEAFLVRERHDAVRRAERIRFYEGHLARGGTAALALHLAAHPDDTQRVLSHLSAEQAALVQNQLHLIDQALQNKQLEDYHLDKPHELIAERMTAILRATTPAEQAPELPHPPLSKKQPEAGT